MTAPKYMYVFEARIFILNSETSTVDLVESRKEFHNREPIIARQATFNYLDSFLHGLMLSIGLTESEAQKVDDRKIRKLLNPYLDPPPHGPKIADDDQFPFSKRILSGITIHLQLNGDEKTIYSISASNTDMPFPVSWGYLEEEYQFYVENGYDTKGYATKITYFDVDEYLEGYEETALGEHHILKTPFIWEGYDKKFWWNEAEGEKEEIQFSREEVLKKIIANGESQTVEFKPTMLYHFQSKSYSRAVRYIIVKTITSFLNANGGFLFIGVTDEKKIQGLAYDFSLARPKGKDPRDYFRLEVDKIIREYFKEFAHNIRGDFETIEGEEVFIFTIYPTKSYPCFIQNAQGIKEFYVRLTTSSEPYLDIEQIARYCIDRWSTFDSTSDSEGK